MSKRILYVGSYIEFRRFCHRNFGPVLKVEFDPEAPIPTTLCGVPVTQSSVLAEREWELHDKEREATLVARGEFAHV